MEDGSIKSYWQNWLNGTYMLTGTVPLVAVGRREGKLLWFPKASG